MKRKSTTATFDDSPPLTQADIDSGKLILRQRDKSGRIIPNKQRVNIYLDAVIVAEFKRRAGSRGYQTLINDSLKEILKTESIEKTIRKVIREELSKKKAA